MSIRRIASSIAVWVWAATAASQACAVIVTRADGQPMNPVGEPFSMKGPFTISKGAIQANCVMTLNGTVGPTGVLTVTSAQFAGAGLCALATGSANSALPWTGQFDNTFRLQLNNMALSVNLLGGCGPGIVAANWTNPSSATFVNAVLSPNCEVAGSLVTSPQLQVQ
ncbi:activator protein [Burkholderia alba]|uniref:activator protein n=1 Tax=Burkholderia alba TaxID=2683677 RepID=UPI002B052C8B|nr:activator protein [Burkholderia alba]